MRKWKCPVLTCFPRFPVLPEGPDLVPPGRPRHGGPEDGDQPRQLRRPLRQPGLVQQPELQVSVSGSLYHGVSVSGSGSLYQGISCCPSVLFCLPWDHNVEGIIFLDRKLMKPSACHSHWGWQQWQPWHSDAGNTMLSSQHRGGINGNQLISTKGWCERSSCRSTFCQQALLTDLINSSAQCTFMLIQTKGIITCRVAGYDPDGHNCYLSAVEVSRLSQLDLTQVRNSLISCLW